MQWSRKGKKKAKKICKDGGRISDTSPPAHLYYCMFSNFYSIQLHILQPVYYLVNGIGPQWI